MANIAVTNFCNLKCPYCFADDMICEEKRHITMDELRRTLSWLARTPKNHVGIIGGEPTLHPHFSDIIKEVNIYCRDCDTGATLFTNGIYLDKFVSELGDRFGILINCNPPEEMGPENEKKFHAMMDHLSLLSWFGRRANCGCNLHIGRTDYSYIWELVERYRLPRLRVSVTAPGGVYTGWRAKKEEYYSRMKPIFLQFCKDAKEHGIHLGSDCNHIPECYYTKSELDLVAEVLEDRPQGFCQPVVDITPDFRATACFGSYDPVDCAQFEDLMQLERYLLLKKSYPRMCANATGRCAGCSNHDLLICQGGCLGFADCAAAQSNSARPLDGAVAESAEVKRDDAS